MYTENRVRSASVMMRTCSLRGKTTLSGRKIVYFRNFFSKMFYMFLFVIFLTISVNFVAWMAGSLYTLHQVAQPSSSPVSPSVGHLAPRQVNLEQKWDRHVILHIISHWNTGAVFWKVDFYENGGHL